MLACGISTLKRREAIGLLTPIRDVEGGAVYYSLDQVAALAGRKVEGGQS
jgi:DNA-binding transcriptional MerR regulator